MQTNSKKQNSKKKCAITHNWLIVTALFTTVGVGITSCVPPVNQTTGERTSKRELHNMAGNSSYAKSKKYKTANRQTTLNAQKQVNADFMNNGIDAETNAIQEFEKLLNSKQNKEQTKNANRKTSQNPSPTLKDDIERLNNNQSALEESILNVKGEILEIKEILSDIDRQRFNATPSRENSANNRATNNMQSLSMMINSLEGNSAENNIAENNNSSENNNNNNNNNSGNSNSSSNVFLLDSDEKANINNKQENATEKKSASSNNAAKPNNEVKIEQKPQIKNTTNVATNRRNNNNNINNNNSKANATNSSADTKTAQQNNSNSVENNTSESNSRTNESDFSDIINRVAKGEYTVAVRLLNEKMQATQDPNTIANCNYWLGECSFNQRDYAKAISHFKSALEGQSGKKDIAQSRIAESYFRVGKNEEAKTAYQNLLRDFPKSTQTPRARKMLQRL